MATGRTEQAWAEPDTGWSAFTVGGEAGEEEDQRLGLLLPSCTAPRWCLSRNGGLTTDAAGTGVVGVAAAAAEETLGTKVKSHGTTGEEDTVAAAATREATITEEVVTDQVEVEAITLLADTVVAATHQVKVEVVDVVCTFIIAPPKLCMPFKL